MRADVLLLYIVFAFSFLNGTAFAQCRIVEPVQPNERDQLAVEIDAQDLNLVRSRARPTLQSQASIGYLEQNSRFGIIDPSNLSGEVASLSLNARAPLYQFGALRSNIRSAVSGLEEASENNLIALMERQANLARSKLAYVYAENIYDIRLAQLQLTKAGVERAEIQFQRGLLSEAALMQKQVEVREDTLREGLAQLNIETTFRELSHLSPNRPHDCSNLPLSALSVQVQLLPSLDQLLKGIKFNSPELRSLKAALRASEYKTKFHKRSRLPALSAEVNAFLNEGPVNFGPFNDRINLSSVEAKLVLSVPLYDGGHLSAEVGKAQAEEQLARLKVLRRERGMRDTVERLHSSLLIHRRKIELLKETLLTVKRLSSIAEKQVELGEASKTDLDQSALEALQAEETLLEAQRDYISIYIDLMEIVEL